MAQRYEVYKCDLCGNIAEILTGAGGALACCGQDMRLLTENTVDAAVEKHIPVATKTGGTWQVAVGSVDHPMAEDHYIEWIELIAGDASYTAFLKPGDKPAASFEVAADEVTVRAYCNLHGLWKG